MCSRRRLIALLTPLIGVIAACGGTTHDATKQNTVAQTPAYKRGYGIGYNAVLIGAAENCRPRSIALRMAGRLKTKADVRDFVLGCNTGATDAVRTK
jgi:hypothetical protein